MSARPHVLRFLPVDYNERFNGCVASLQEECGRGVKVGERVMTGDEESNRCEGTVERIAKGLVYTLLDWDTWTPSEVIPHGSNENVTGAPRLGVQRVSNPRRQGGPRPEKLEGLAERLEGTDPLTDEEIRALLLMEPSGPLPENGHEARAIASARAKLRARLE